MSEHTAEIERIIRVCMQHGDMKARGDVRERLRVAKEATAAIESVLAGTLPHNTYGPSDPPADFNEDDER